MFDLPSKRALLKEVYLYLNLDNPSLTSSLAPILGQYGIKPTDFINMYLTEKGSSFFISDIVISLKVHLYRSGKYFIYYASPSINFLLKQLFQFTLLKNDIELINLYKILLLKEFNINKQILF
jgi:hypothetical protein